MKRGGGDDGPDGSMPERTVGSNEVWDVQGTYSGFKTTTIALGVRNLFDRAPPFSNQSSFGQVMYDPRYADPRVGAAVILSGAEIPYLSAIRFSSPSPPLLAIQGTADTINPPSFTNTFFEAAPAPKYLVRLLGAPHLPPYTDMEPQLGIVERAWNPRDRVEIEPVDCHGVAVGEEATKRSRSHCGIVEGDKGQEVTST